MEHRGASVLLVKAKEGGERERIEATELLEFRKDEAGVPIEFDRLAFDARNKLQVFRGTPTFELGWLTARHAIVDAGLRERLEREMGERSWHRDGYLLRDGVGSH